MLYLNHYHPHSLVRGWKRQYYQKKLCGLIQKNQQVKILVILHLFYPESWDEIKEYLKNLAPYHWDLVVTYPTEIESNLHLQRVLDFKNDAVFKSYPNKGYDIGPFLLAISEIDLNQYDVVFKLQSKGVKRKLIYLYNQAFIGRDWFVNLFEGILNPKNVHITINALSNKKAGLICAKNLIVKDPIYKENIVKKGLSERGISINSSYDFVAGTCFAIKASLLKDYKKFGFLSEDFETIPRSRGMSLAHLMERYFCIPVLTQGYSIDGNDVCLLSRTLKKPLESLLHRWSSERLLETNYHIDDEYFYWKLDNLLVRFREKEVVLGDLKYPSDIKKKNIPLVECAPFQYLSGNTEDYSEYAKYHEDNGFPLMTSERYEKLISSLETNGYNNSNIILVDDRNVIADGQHRACYLAYKYGIDYKIKVLEIMRINKKGLVKMMVPKFIQRHYYLKKYGTY